MRGCECCGGFLVLFQKVLLTSVVGNVTTAKSSSFPSELSTSMMVLLTMVHVHVHEPWKK